MCAQYVFCLNSFRLKSGRLEPHSRPQWYQSCTNRKNVSRLLFRWNRLSQKRKQNATRLGMASWTSEGPKHVCIKISILWISQLYLSLVTGSQRVISVQPCNFLAWDCENLNQFTTGAIEIQKSHEMPSSEPIPYWNTEKTIGFMQIRTEPALNMGQILYKSFC